MIPYPLAVQTKRVKSSSETYVCNREESAIEEPEHAHKVKDKANADEADSDL